MDLDIIGVVEHALEEGCSRLVTREPEVGGKDANMFARNCRCTQCDHNI